MWLLQSRYHQAKMSVQERATKVAAIVESLERDMELLCVTGVEDKLHDGVRSTLELLRNAGIKVCLPLDVYCLVLYSVWHDGATTGALLWRTLQHVFLCLNVGGIKTLLQEDPLVFMSGTD